jgi:hypothetical protein
LEGKRHWTGGRSESVQNIDTNKLIMFVKLLFWFDFKLFRKAVQGNIELVDV